MSVLCYFGAIDGWIHSLGSLLPNLHSVCVVQSVNAFQLAVELADRIALHPSSRMRIRKNKQVEGMLKHLIQ